MNKAGDSYAKALQILFNKLGTSDKELRFRQIKQLWNKFDIKLNEPRIIHVTGTNGKGSVVYKWSRILSNFGFKTGLFVSPHISWVRERIWVDNNKIPEDTFWSLYKLIENEDISFFSSMFLISLMHFKQQKCEYLWIEAGIGGYNSITNILDSDVSAITSIGYDHQDILGETLEAITLDKAGVIKHKRPVVIGATVDRKLIEPIARKLNSDVIIPSDISINTPFEQHNKSIAREMIKCLSKTDDKLKQKFDKESTMIGIDERLPYRMQNINSILPEFWKAYNNVDTYADVWHNVQGFKGTIDSINSTYGKWSIHVLLGT